MKILVTGGTVFVSKYMAEYFVKHGHDVYVLNRNTKPQTIGTSLIQADRNNLGCKLKNINFDAVVDVNAYNAQDVNNLLDALDGFNSYVLISSSAVYPETEKQPFTENTKRSVNKFWGDYGLGKIEAENALTKRVKNAYIIRPPYIYGEYNNVYREAFVFDCADNDLPFYIPESDIKLQFIHVHDVCRFAEILITEKPRNNIYNVGAQTVSITEWVNACYAAAGKTSKLIYVNKKIEQRNYFPFYAYSCELDCTLANLLMPNVIDLNNGLKRAYAQYITDKSLVRRKDYINYIENNLKNRE